MTLTKKILLTVALFAVGLTHAEVIKDIRIINQKGESYDISSVAAFTTYSIGDEVGSRETILSSIAVDVNRMRDSGRYSFVDASMDVEEEGVVLIYTVTTKNKLRRVEFSGADNMRNRKVRKKSELEIGTFADDATFAQAATKIKDAYREFWYPDTKVTWEASINEELGVVDVKFLVDEGERLVIKKLVFKGEEDLEKKGFFDWMRQRMPLLKEERIDGNTLKKVMQQKQKHWFPLWSRITGSGKYRPEFTDLDVFSIKTLYMNEGYLDVKVKDPYLVDDNVKKGHVVYNVNTGRRYAIGDLSLVGNEKFETKELLVRAKLRSGDVASYKAVDAMAESIRAYYGNRGYINVGVRPVFNADPETGYVDVEFSITEGSIGYIKNINIVGQERTKDEVIRRELIVYPGDKYNRGWVRTSENRLRNLNYFDAVTANPLPTSESDKYDLNVKVHDKRTGSFSAGVGFSSIDSLVGYVEWSQGNFSITDWPSVGGGQKLKIRAQLGAQRNDLDISFVEPWFMDRKLSFGVDLFHREARYFSDNYDQQNDGMRLSLGKPLSRFSRGSIAYTLEQFDVFDVAPTASASIQQEAGKRLKSGLDFMLTRDTRDRFFNPTRGNKTVITPYFAGGPLGGQTDIFGGRIKSTQYWPVFGGDTILNVRGQIETVESYGDSKAAAAGAYGEGVPIFDRLFLGGSYNLRGFEFREVGPVEGADEDPLGGKSSAFITVEYTVPLWNKIRGAIFYDAGFVNEDFMDFKADDYNSDWGMGLRFDLPGFPLQLDYAFPIEAAEHNDSSGRFNFFIGHTF